MGALIPNLLGYLRTAQLPVLERLVRAVGGRSAHRWLTRLEGVPVSFWRRCARRPKIWPEHPQLRRRSRFADPLRWPDRPGHLPPIAGGAVVEASAAGGKWSEAKAWVGEVVPTAADDVRLTAASGSITISAEASCQSLDCTGYTKTLKSEATLSIGSAGTAGTNIALKLVAGMTFTANAAFWSFVSTSATTQLIFTGGKTLPTVRFVKSGKYQLEEKLTSAELLSAFETAELKTNGQEVVCELLEAANTATLNLGASKVKLSGTGTVWKVVAGNTLNAGTSTIEVTNAGTAAKKFVGAGKTYNVVSFAGNNIELTGSNTIATLGVNTALASKSCKGTLTALSNHLVVTAEEANLTVGVEITGTGIPASTTIVKKIEAKVWEMSANATETVVVAETITIFPIGLLVGGNTVQTIEALTTNGKAGEQARMASAVSGTKFKLKKAAGNVAVDFMRLRDSKGEGGPTWCAGASSTNVSGNETWKFEVCSAPVEILLLAASASSSASLGVTAPTLIPVQGASSQSAALCAFTVPTQVPADPAASASAASAALSAPTAVPLQTARSDSADSLAPSARTAVSLDPAHSASAARLAPSAPTRVLLDGASAASVATAALSAPAQVAPQAAASQSAASAALSAFTELPLDPAASASAASATMTAPTELPLGPARSDSAASLALSARTAVPLGACTSDSAASLRIGSPTVLSLTPAASASAAGLDLSVRAVVRLQAAASATSATAALSARAMLVPDAASSSSGASLDLRTRAQVPLQAAAAVSGASLGLAAPTRVALAPASSASVGSLVLSSPTAVPLEPAVAVSSTRLHISIPMAPGYASTVLVVAFPAATALGSIADASTSIASLVDASTAIEVALPASTTVEKKAEAGSDLLPT